MKSNSEIKQIEPSIILADLTFEGDIIGEGAIEIEGRVNGNIRCLSASIGAKGFVAGDITAERVEILGEVNGNIVAKKIICGSSAKIRGDILHSIIHIENGADLEGNCRKFVPSEVVAFEEPAEASFEEAVIEEAPVQPEENFSDLLTEVEESSVQQAREVYKSADLVYKKEA